MVISTLNGSPKASDSNSEMNLSVIEERLDKENIIKRHTINKKLLSKDEVREIVLSDVLIIAFPLYIDGIPSHLLEQMIILEKAYQVQEHKKTVVYVVANNGFYEGDQNEYALQMVENFCLRAGICWGQGIGIGAGEMIGQLCKEKMPVNKGPLKSYGKAIESLVSNIKNQTCGEKIYTYPNFPVFLFKLIAHYHQWDGNAKKNGISKRQMRKRIIYNQN